MICFLCGTVSKNSYLLRFLSITRVAFVLCSEQLKLGHVSINLPKKSAWDNLVDYSDFFFFFLMRKYLVDQCNEKEE